MRDEGLFVERRFLCAVPPRRSAKTPHVRFALETVHNAAEGGFGLWWCFIPPPCASRKEFVRVEGERSAGVASALSSLRSCWWRWKSARRFVISAVRCSAKRNLPSGVTLTSPLACHETLSKFEWRFGHELAPPGAVVHQGSHSAKVAGRLR